jgi:Holliday junction resolvasome RuvABC endonuclease subunit
MMVYEEVLRKLMSIVKFDCFVTEDIFCMPNRVSAFRILSLYIEMYEKIANIEKQKQLYTVPPTLIKKYISNYGHTDKSLVQRDVLNHKSIIIQKTSDMTHHESDAIAGAYAFVMGFLAADI